VIAARTARLIFANLMKKNKTYHIVVIGCQMNKSDSERIAGYLESRGYVRSERDGADLVVLTTCGVRQSAEDRIYGLAPRIKRKNPKTKIVLTGCLSLRKDVRERLDKYIDIWMPITELDSLGEKIGTKDEEKGSLSGYLAVAPKYESKLSAFVPIGNGCDNFCAYCVVPYARGREVYRDAEEILAEIEKLAKRGYKEIILIAQNVNSYRSKIANSETITFSRLLRMVNDIPGNFWIRFSTSHPKDMSDDLIDAVAECEKVCEHIHLPVQAGDNEILRRMNRKYTREHYIGLIAKIRKKIPNANITTDIIVGFPGETEEQFGQTAQLFKEVKFDMAYIAQYSPRFGTPAARLNDDVPRAEKKRREEELMGILRQTALANNEKYLGKTIDVFVKGKNKKGEWTAETRTFKKVKIKRANRDSRIADLAGEFAKIKIYEVEDFGMRGEIIR